MVLTSGGGSHGGSDPDGHRPGRTGNSRRASRTLVTSIIDIDLSMTDIVFHRRDNGFAGLGVNRPATLVDYAIEGVVRPGGAATPGEGAPEPYLVYVSGYAQSDRLDRNEDVDPRSVCYIATESRADDAWRTNIYIERFLFRRLIELYATRRIDSAKLSILLKVLRDSSGAVELPSQSHPMLRSLGGRHRQHSRAHLMSVQTSLGAAPVHSAIGVSSGWGGRMGRRRALPKS